MTPKIDPNRVTDDKEVSPTLMRDMSSRGVPNNQRGRLLAGSFHGLDLIDVHNNSSKIRLAEAIIKDLIRRDPVVPDDFLLDRAGH